MSAVNGKKNPNPNDKKKMNAKQTTLANMQFQASAMQKHTEELKIENIRNIFEIFFESLLFALPLLSDRYFNYLG